MPRDILIVDDMQELLGHLSELTQSEFGIVPFTATSAPDALEVLREHPVKVLLTDELMPEMRGSELIRKVKRELNLKILCVMMTAFEDSIDRSGIVSLGLFAYLQKPFDSNSFVDMVRDALDFYEYEVVMKTGISVDRVVYSKTSLVSFNAHYTVKLSRITMFVDPYVRDEEWKTELMSDLGIKRTMEFNITRKASSAVESSRSLEIASHSDLRSKVIAEIQVALEGRMLLDKKLTESHEVTIERKETVEIKDLDDQTTTGQKPRSREYQAAPAYSRINCRLEVQCSCCNMPQSFNVILEIPNGKMALRHVDHYDDGMTRTVETGFVVADTVRI